MSTKLERTGCAESGLNPKAVYEFIKRCDEERLGLDGFMLLKDGKVAAEGFYSPYTAETPHVLYSMSKSFSSLALGFAVDEGLLTLDTSISDVFPEYDPKGKNRAVTFRHLVTMTSGKLIGMAAARHKRDWIKIFFDAPFFAPPGKVFFYVNDNFYMISAAVSRLTGLTLIDYLMPRLFEPLGIDRPFWETDMFGYASGGWGLYMPLEDMAKVWVCCSKGGVWEGRQIIPKAYLDEATAYQVPTVKHGQPDVTKGYGFGFWRVSIPDTWRAYGLHGQFGYVFENRDTVLAVNCGIARDAAISAAINDMFKTLWDEPDAEYEGKLREYCENLGDKENLYSPYRNEELEKKYSWFKLRTHSPVFASMVHLTITTVLDDKLGNTDSFMLQRNAAGDMFLQWTEGGYANTIRLGMDGSYAESPVKLGSLMFTACAKAAWTSDKTFTVLVRLRDTCTVRKLEFDFSNERLIRIRNDSFPDLGNLAAYYLDFSGFPLPGPLDKVLTGAVIPAIKHTLAEPTYLVLNRFA